MVDTRPQRIGEHQPIAHDLEIASGVREFLSLRRQHRRAEEAARLKVNLAIDWAAPSFKTRPAAAPQNEGGARAVLYFFTYFCTRQFSVSVTKISARALTAM